MSGVDSSLAVFCVIANVIAIIVLLYNDSKKQRAYIKELFNSYNLSKDLLELDSNKHLLYKELNRLKTRVYIPKIRKEVLAKLNNDYQKIIHRIVWNQYFHIVEMIKLKKLNLSIGIYREANNLVITLSKYMDYFDSDNNELSSAMLEKLSIILNFTKKYYGYTFNYFSNEIDNMNGNEFEKYCANLLIAYGFEKVTVTKSSGDQGVDIVGCYGGDRFAIQCKRYSTKVSNNSIQEVVAGKKLYDCQRTLVMTNNYFTKSAIELAKVNDVVLWNRDSLLELVYQVNDKWDAFIKEIEIITPVR